MFLKFILPGIILLAGVIDDLRSQKIHNKLVIVLFLVTLIYIFLFQGLPGFLWALSRLFLALVITVPLVLLRIIGGGDMKLYAVLSLTLSFQGVFLSLICAFFWGAILGLIKTILDKKMGLMYSNFFSLLKLEKPSADTLNKFPFSISLLLGWLSAFYF